MSTSPASTARRTMPSPSGPSNSRGKIETRSNLTIACHAGPDGSRGTFRSSNPSGASMTIRRSGRVDRAADVHRQRNQQLARRRCPPPDGSHHPRHRPCVTVADLGAVRRLDLAPDEVVVVVHARRQRQQVSRARSAIRAPRAAPPARSSRSPSNPTTGRIRLKPDRAGDNRARPARPSSMKKRRPGWNRSSAKSVSGFRITSPRRPCGRATRATTTRSSQRGVFIPSRLHRRSSAPAPARPELDVDPESSCSTVAARQRADGRRRSSLPADQPAEFRLRHVHLDHHRPVVLGLGHRHRRRPCRPAPGRRPRPRPARGSLGRRGRGRARVGDRLLDASSAGSSPCCWAARRRSASGPGARGRPSASPAASWGL